MMIFTFHQSYVSPVSVNAPVSVNVENNGRYRSCYCKRVYNNGTVSVKQEHVMIICMISTLFVNNVDFISFRLMIEFWLLRKDKAKLFNHDI